MYTFIPIQLHLMTHAATTRPSIQPTASKRSLIKAKSDVIREISPPGWYRFTGIAGNPKMPTTCPPIRRCGTHAPGWIKGQHPSMADREVTRVVCYHWSNNCCRWKNNIKVKNCGAFYVYQLQKTPVCSLRYCGEYWRFIDNTC